MVIVQHPIQTILFWGTGRDHYRATPDMTCKCDHLVEVMGYQGFKAPPDPHMDHFFDIIYYIYQLC